jgi:putative SOS response-associated peptidase YedK
MVPVIIANSPHRIVLMRWGLIPHCAKDEKTADKMINARVETLTQRPAFPGPAEPQGRPSAGLWLL